MIERVFRCPISHAVLTNPINKFSDVPFLMLEEITVDNNKFSDVPFLTQFRPILTTHFLMSHFSRGFDYSQQHIAQITHDTRSHRRTVTYKLVRLTDGRGTVTPARLPELHTDRTQRGHSKH